MFVNIYTARTPSRPKSAILAAVEKKVFSLPENFEKEETPTESDSMDLSTFLYGRQDDFQVRVYIKQIQKHTRSRFRVQQQAC